MESTEERVERHDAGSVELKLAGTAIDEQAG
jgi:hypothetical protein